MESPYLFQILIISLDLMYLFYIIIFSSQVSDHEFIYFWTSFLSIVITITLYKHIVTTYNVFITFVRQESFIMTALPQISEAEFEVMGIVWKHASISTNEITEKLLQTTPWSLKTIQTLIKRLANKGALSYEKQGRVYVYTPLVKENEYIDQKSRSFLKRYFGGNLSAMVASCLENDRLSEIEIKQLRSLLCNKTC